MFGLDLDLRRVFVQNNVRNLTVFRTKFQILYIIVYKKKLFKRENFLLLKKSEIQCDFMKIRRRCKKRKKVLDVHSSFSAPR